MKTITFVTGNTKKAEYLAKYFDGSIVHRAVELDELQSLSLHTIVEHKVRQAFDLLKTPVIVEDVALEFDALHGLPGPFIKFFLERMSFDELCALPKNDIRGATARCVMGFFDGVTLQLFEGSLRGTVAEKPTGREGYGWDRIFIPEGYNVTRASLDENDDRKTYLMIKPFEALSGFLKQWGNRD